jgi:hypothetical protein
MWRFVLMALVALVVASACDSQHERKVGAEGLIEGDYRLVSTLEPHTLDVVRITVVNNFECRACASLESKMTDLQAKYKDRISVDYYDVLNPETRTAVIAHYVLKQGPRAHELRDYLYANLAAAGSKGPAMEVLVNRFGMNPAVMNDPSVILEINRRDRLARHITSATPTLVIQGQIAVGGDVGKISHILDQLLVEGQE